MSVIRIVVLAILAFGAGLGASGSAAAQAYPGKPIHIVVPFAPGASPTFWRARSARS
jgi:tripartite-type tricarboxylate transporter receptor subunit TctC